MDEETKKPPIQNINLGFIGGGNMAQAIGFGLINKSTFISFLDSKFIILIYFFYDLQMY